MAEHSLSTSDGTLEFLSLFNYLNFYIPFYYNYSILCPFMEKKSNLECHSSVLLSTCSPGAIFPELFTFSLLLLLLASNQDKKIPLLNFRFFFNLISPETVACLIVMDHFNILPWSRDLPVIYFDNDPFKNIISFKIFLYKQADLFLDFHIFLFVISVIYDDIIRFHF